jgi:hypothetical protein
MRQWVNLCTIGGGLYQGYEEDGAVFIDFRGRNILTINEEMARSRAGYALLSTPFPYAT